MPALTRGPLPSSVYWRRRLIVLTVVLVLLWAMLHLLRGGDSGTPKASPAADLTGTSASVTSSTAASPSAPSNSPSAGTSQAPSTSPSVAAETPTPSPTALPTPTGACPPSDLSVTPSVTGAAAGSPVSIVLTLATFTTPACTWHVSHKTMQVKVATAKGTDVWSTIDCPAALPTSDVVVYRDQPTPVTVTWSGRRSDATCSAHTAYSWPGDFSVTGVALGGTPDQTSFTLGAAVATQPAAPTTPAAPAAPTTSAPAAGSTTPSTQPASPSASGSPATTPKKKHHKKKHVVAD